jgi:hypothetical protein
MESCLLYKTLRPFLTLAFSHCVQPYLVFKSYQSIEFIETESKFHFCYDFFVQIIYSLCRELWFEPTCFVEVFVEEEEGLLLSMQKSHSKY